MPIDPSLLWSPTALAVLAVAFQLVGYVLRGELWLRILLLVGTGFYIAYYATAAQNPMWDAIWGSVLLAVANLWALTFVILDRSTLPMTPRMRALYGHFPTFNPGQFRRIMRHARWLEADGETQLCRQGTVPEALYYVIDGQIDLTRDGKQARLPAGRFVGEMSFLHGTAHPANANVTVSAGTRYIAWDRARLRQQMDRSQSLSNAVSALLTRDLLGKLDQSWPDRT